MASARKKKSRRTRSGPSPGTPAAQPAADPPPPPPARRTRRFRLLAIGLGLLVAWGIPELLVRIANPPLQAYRAIAFGGDPNSEKLFMKDGRLHWKLRPDVETTFRDVTVRTDHHGFRSDEPVPGRRVVLCLGDSTPFGYRVGQQDPFPARLQTRLNKTGGPGPEWSVLNAGVPGYTSHQIRRQAEELVPRWKPSVIVVCVGNNEAWPVERSDRQLDTDRAVTGRIVSVLSASRFLVWAAEKIRREEPRPFIAPTLDHAVPRVSLDEFGENLRAIAQLARDSGARLVLLSPPVNLYWPPMRFNQFEGWEEWQALYTRLQELRGAGEGGKITELARAALAAHPDSFYALWINGMVQTDLGDIDGGRELLEQAIEHHAFPENCRRSYRRVVARTAEEEQAAFLDVNELLRHQAKGPVPQALYLDWCHPTAEGHGYIAEALAHILAGKGDGAYPPPQNNE